MKATPLFTIILIISYSKELSTAKQTEIKNNIVRRAAIDVGVLGLYRKDVLSFTRTQEKIESIMCCKVTVCHSPQCETLRYSCLLYRRQRCTAMVNNKGLQTAHRIFCTKIIVLSKLGRHPLTTRDYRMGGVVCKQICIFCSFIELISFADCH